MESFECEQEDSYGEDLIDEDDLTDEDDPIDEDDLIDEDEMEETRDELLAEIEELKQESEEFKKLNGDEIRKMETWGFTDEEDADYDPDEDKEFLHPEGSEESESEEENEEETLADRISGLADSLIVRILCGLPTIDEVIRTGILSKRWRYVWTSIPKLNFPCQTDVLCIPDFVTQTLVQCVSSKIESFKLIFDFEPRFVPQLNIWIRYALVHHVEELEIGLNCSRYPIRPMVPDYLLTSSVLTSLSLKCFRFVPDAPVAWKSLKKLSIRHSNLSEDVIGTILSGSPVLESLELGLCYGFRRLDVCSVSVRKLVFDGYYVGEEDDVVEVVEINASNILVLEIIGAFGCRKLALSNVQCLVEANIEFEKMPIAYEREMVKGLLHSLSHVTHLTVGSHFMQVFKSLEMEGWSCLLSKCKCLQVNFVKRGGFLGIENLRLCSPDPEGLLANSHSLMDDGAFPTTQNNGTCQKGSIHRLQLQLKTFKIACSAEWDNELIQCLLNNACALEKIIICASGECWNETELLQAATKLLSFPRASKEELQVVLEPPALK